MRTSSFSTNTCASHKSSPAAFPSDPRLVTLRSRAPTQRATVSRFCHSLERSQPLLAPSAATVRIRDFERGGIPRKLALSHFDETALSVQGNVQLVRQLSRAKRTAGKIAARDVQCGNSSLAVIRAQHNLLRFMVLLDVDFPELHSALFQKHFHAPAVRAPSCTVDRDRLHPLFCCHSLCGSGLQFTLKAEGFIPGSLPALTRRRGPLSLKENGVPPLVLPHLHRSAAVFPRDLDANQGSLQRNRGPVPVQICIVRRQPLFRARQSRF